MKAVCRFSISKRRNQAPGAVNTDVNLHHLTSVGAFLRRTRDSARVTSDSAIASGMPSHSGFPSVNRIIHEASGPNATRRTERLLSRT